MRSSSDYLVQVDHRAATYNCACGDCDWRGRINALDDIEGCSLTPGDASPAGRCPDCGALAYPDEPDRAKGAAQAVLAALKRLTLCADYDCGEDRVEVELAVAQATAAIAAAEGRTT